MAVNLQICTVFIPEVDGLKLKMDIYQKAEVYQHFRTWTHTEMQHTLHVDMIQQDLQTADYCSNMKWHIYGAGRAEDSYLILTLETC